MRRLEEMRDFFIQTIDRYRVLDQIVRADTEEFQASGQSVGHHHGGRGLNHRANFNRLVKSDVPLTQLGFIFFEERVGLVQFVQP